MVHYCVPFGSVILDEMGQWVGHQHPVWGLEDGQGLQQGGVGVLVGAWFLPYNKYWEVLAPTPQR